MEECFGAGIEAEGLAGEILGESGAICRKDVIELHVVTEFLRPGEEGRRVLHRAEDRYDSASVDLTMEQRHPVGVAFAVYLHDDDENARWEVHDFRLCTR